jgi:hypothetical protein
MEFAQYAQIAKEVIEDSINDAFTELDNKALLVETIPTPSEVPSSPIPDAVSPTTVDIAAATADPPAADASTEPPASVLPEHLVLEALPLAAEEPVYLTMTLDGDPSPAAPKERSETAYSFLSTPTDTPHSNNATPRSDLAYSGKSDCVDPFPHMSASSDAAVQEGGMNLSGYSSRESLALSVSSGSPLHAAAAQAEMVSGDGALAESGADAGGEEVK